MKRTKTVQMYAANTADGDAIADLMFVKDGVIKLIQWEIQPAAVSVGDIAEYEVSFMNARQGTTDEATGLVSRCGVNFTGAAAAGAGMATMVDKQFAHPVNYPYKAGEKLYLHAERTGAANSHRVRAILHCEE